VFNDASIPDLTTSSFAARLKTLGRRLRPLQPLLLALELTVYAVGLTCWSLQLWRTYDFLRFAVDSAGRSMLHSFAWISHEGWFALLVLAGIWGCISFRHVAGYWSLLPGFVRIGAVAASLIGLHAAMTYKILMTPR
jgi:hypothetical protein